jgi:GTP cyclohydrolase I
MQVQERLDQIKTYKRLKPLGVAVVIEAHADERNTKQNSVTTTSSLQVHLKTKQEESLLA